MVDRENCPGAGHHSVLMGYSLGVQVNQVTEVTERQY